MSDPRIIPDETLTEWQADTWSNVRISVNEMRRRQDMLIEHGKALAEQVEHKTAWAADLQTALLSAHERAEKAEADAHKQGARAYAAEVKIRQWEDRVWVSVYERAVWQHEQGKHAGDVPFAYCPICERIEATKATNAAEQRLADLTKAIRDLADEWDGTAITDQVCGSDYADDLRALLPEDGD